MDKTIKEWFETIEDPEIRAKAFANTRPCDLKIESYSLWGSLPNAFIWISSPEGYEYWSNFRATLNNK
jgi:hypothetical protein